MDMASTVVGVVLGPVGAEWGTPIPLVSVQPEDGTAASYSRLCPQEVKDVSEPAATLIDPAGMAGSAAAVPPASSVDAALPLEPSKKRRRRRAPAPALTEEQLDAIHPGNVRHRSVLLLLQPAMCAYERWLQGRGGAPPWLQEPQPQQRLQQNMEEENNGLMRKDEDGQEQHLHTEADADGHHVHAAGGIRDAASSSGSEHGLEATADGGSAASTRTNWPALYALRHTLKPKIHLPASCSAGMATDSADEQRPTPPCCCYDVHSLRQDVGPEEAATPGQSTHTLSSGLVAFNLFGSVVSNAHCQALLVTAHEDTVLLPPQSRFLMSCGVGTLGPLLQDGTQYKLVVMDPPWENASARRSRQYPTLAARELLRLPLPQLLRQDGLVAMWVTNRDRIHRCINQELLPRWGLRLLRTWFWVKVARESGLPVSPLHCRHRHCYEHLLLLVPDRAPTSAAAEAEASAGVDEDWSALPPDGFALVSCPGQHSRKPSAAALGRLLGSLRKVPSVEGDGGACLELFGRELHAHWTTWGNEVLHFQQANTTD